MIQGFDVITKKYCEFFIIQRYQMTHDIGVELNINIVRPQYKIHNMKILKLIFLFIRIAYCQRSASNFNIKSDKQVLRPRGCDFSQFCRPSRSFRSCSPCSHSQLQYSYSKYKTLTDILTLRLLGLLLQPKIYLSDCLMSISLED